MSFRVDLPLFCGPLDLLLYLLRRHELDSAEVALATVIDQYAHYIEILGELDLTEVGDFVDLASTLIEFKSQAALPSPEDDDDQDTAVVAEQEPTEMIARLLQYKEIRDAAAILEEMGRRWQTRYTRLSDDLPRRRIDPGDQPIVDLEIWDLVSAYGRIMREFAAAPATEVVYDETPIHVYMQQIHGRLADEPTIALVDLVDGGVHKSAIIGWFLAALELTRHHGAAIAQNEYGDIVVVRSENYRRDLNVAEIDNYDASEMQDAGMPGMPR